MLFVGNILVKLRQRLRVDRVAHDSADSEVVDIGTNVLRICDTADADIVDRHVPDRLAEVALNLIHTLHIATLDIADMDSVNLREPLLVCRHKFAPLVKHLGVNLKHVYRSNCLYAIHVNVLYESTAPVVGLYEKEPVQQTRSHTVVHVHIADAA